jgi:hypothetical protein
MACLTKFSVSEELIGLMGAFGFSQIDALSPNVSWSNLNNMTISHPYNFEPKKLEDILQLIYYSGYNQGIHDQFNNITNELKQGVEKSLLPAKLYSKF